MHIKHTLTSSLTHATFCHIKFNIIFDIIKVDKLEKDRKGPKGKGKESTEILYFFILAISKMETYNSSAITLTENDDIIIGVKKLIGKIKNYH